MGVPPQTDFTPPELVSFALETDEVAAGKGLKSIMKLTMRGPD